MDSNQIRDLIRRRGFTYETLAAEIGVTRAAIGEIVSGRTRGATARYSFARALDCRVEDIWPEPSANGGAAA